MAEYTQTTTFGTSMGDLNRMWNNTTTKTFIERYMTLIDAQLDLVDAGGVAYSFTQATWDTAVNKALAELNNETNRKCFKDFADLISVDWVDIAANGMSYTRDITYLNAIRCFETATNSIHKELLHEMIALIIIELDLIVAAS